MPCSLINSHSETLDSFIRMWRVRALEMLFMATGVLGYEGDRNLWTGRQNASRRPGAKDLLWSRHHIGSLTMSLLGLVG